MPTSSWIDVEDIALVEAWEEVYNDPPRRGQGVYGSVCNNILHNSVVRTTAAPLTPYLQGSGLYAWTDLGEENIKAVALINYLHKEGHDFEHVLQWETMRVWL
ncbi:hypothetical protein Hanom_Chr07g00632821 [Helianthus anomalus]